MSDGATLRVTPAELAGVSGQVRVLTRTCSVGSVELRNVLGRVDPPDRTADEVLLLSARATHAALGEASELLGSLLAELARGLERQARALAAAAHGYEYVEWRVSAAIRPGGRRHE